MMKKILAITLCVLLLLGALCGCSKKLEILPEVADAYEIDSVAEKKIDAMFEAFDKAFEALEKSKPIDDKDFWEYAQAVSDADCYDDVVNSMILADKMLSTDGEKKDHYSSVHFSAAPVRGASTDLLIERMNFLIPGEDASGERYAEAAFNMVNAYSNFLYGVDWITEEDMDRLE